MFVGDLTFSKACLCSIFFYVGIIVRTSVHVASYLQAGAKTAGCILAGSIAAGVAVQILLQSISDCKCPVCCAELPSPNQRSLQSAPYLFLPDSFGVPSQFR